MMWSHPLTSTFYHQGMTMKFYLLIATKLMIVTSYSFHSMLHLFTVKQDISVILVLDVLLYDTFLDSLCSLSTLIIVFKIWIHFRSQTNEFDNWNSISFISFTNCFLLTVSLLDNHYCQTDSYHSKSLDMHHQAVGLWLWIIMFLNRHTSIWYNYCEIDTLAT